MGDNKSIITVKTLFYRLNDHLPVFRLNISTVYVQQRQYFYLAEICYARQAFSKFFFRDSRTQPLFSFYRGNCTSC